MLTLYTSHPYRERRRRRFHSGTRGVTSLQGRLLCRFDTDVGDTNFRGSLPKAEKNLDPVRLFIGIMLMNHYFTQLHLRFKVSVLGKTFWTRMIICSRGLGN